jgi:hypothetical protein
MRLDSALKNVVPDISRPKKSGHFWMHWMSVKKSETYPVNSIAKEIFWAEIYRSLGAKQEINHFM